MQIFVVRIGKTIIFTNIHKDEFILTIKDKIQELDHIPIDKQKLVYKGNYLDNNRTLSYYKIQDESIIELKNMDDVKPAWRYVSNILNILRIVPLVKKSRA